MKKRRWEKQKLYKGLLLEIETRESLGIMIKEREERVSEADQMKRDPKNLTLIITKKLIIIAMAKKIKVFVLSNKK